MKEIVVHKSFTLTHGGQKVFFKQGGKYPVEDDVADHWWTKQHASEAGQKFEPEKPEPSQHTLEPAKMIKGAPPFAVAAEPSPSVAEAALDPAPEPAAASPEPQAKAPPKAKK